MLPDVVVPPVITISNIIGRVSTSRWAHICMEVSHWPSIPDKKNISTPSTCIVYDVSLGCSGRTDSKKPSLTGPNPKHGHSAIATMTSLAWSWSSYSGWKEDLHSELALGSRPTGHPHLRFKAVSKPDMEELGIGAHRYDSTKYKSQVWQYKVQITGMTVQSTNTHTYTHTHTHIHMHTHTHTQTHTHTYSHHKHTYSHTPTQANIHSHKQIYILTHTHMYTHKHTYT